jgi:ribose transport system permease protein
MSRLAGIFLFVVLLYGGLMATGEDARKPSSQRTIAKRLGYYGVLTVGVGVLIVSGGIDLSIGSVVGLGSVLFGLMLERGTPPWQAALLVLAVSAVIGLFHGVLVTSLGLQPFLVTLCGLFIYRGLARCLTQTSVGLGVDVADPAFQAEVRWFRALLTGDGLLVPHQLVILALIAVVLGVFLHATVHGRYLFAIGANEEAARYAGIPTARYKVLAYVICSTLAGLASILEILDARGAEASNAGNLQELYAITGAVLGGCSLRGGEGNILGMVLGTAVIPLLRLLCTFAIEELANELEYVVIGVALLLGTITDEMLKRRAARRAAARRT